MGEEDSTPPVTSRKTDPKAFISILRIQNCVIGGLTVISGIALAYQARSLLGLETLPLSQYLPLFLLGYFAYFLVAAGGNIVNDIFDIEIDKVNRPHRALPSGRMTIRQAWIYTGVLSAIAAIFALMIGIWACIIVVIFEVVGYAYAAKGKTLGIAGNLMVAFSFAFGEIFGALIYSETVFGQSIGDFFVPLPVWLFFITAFMILQARETIKGAEDVEGDEIRDVRTIARVYGYRAAAGVSALLNLIGITCYILVWVLGYASWNLWPLLLLGAAVVIGAGVAPLLGPKNPKMLVIGSTLDKIGALVGLIAFVIVPIYGISLLP
ncbi:MAG: geranylgeranylglycerol-phosphate geranylgeranyltransferase [Candidatus Thorarchaeota archaeon]